MRYNCFVASSILRSMLHFIQPCGCTRDDYIVCPMKLYVIMFFFVVDLSILSGNLGLFILLRLFHMRWNNRMYTFSSFSILTFVRGEAIYFGLFVCHSVISITGKVLVGFDWFSRICQKLNNWLEYCGVLDHPQGPGFNHLFHLSFQVVCVCLHYFWKTFTLTALTSFLVNNTPAEIPCSSALSELLGRLNLN